MRISTEQSDINVSFVHDFLSTRSTWAKGIDYATVEKSIRHSLCFAGFVENTQIAFARVISDFATYANLVDVFVIDQHRGKGFSKQLVGHVMQHADLQNLRRFTLVTSNAHGLYRQFGFTKLASTESYMERYSPTIYTN